MNEKFLYDTIMAAYSGTVHAEELTAGVAADCFHVNNGVGNLDIKQTEETLHTIHDTLSNVGRVLCLLSEIHSRNIAIEEAAEALAAIERPERKFMEVPDGFNPDLPYA